MTSAIKYAEQGLAILSRDGDSLDRIEKYFRGEHDEPYMPDNAEEEYKLLVKRAITNWMPLLVHTPAQGLYVDNFRKGGAGPLEDLEDSPEWMSWQQSRLDGRQYAIYMDALKFGHSFVLTEKTKAGKVISKNLSARRTVALYDDPAADLDPVAAVYVKRWATGSKPEDAGILHVWDETNKYELSYVHGESPKVTRTEPHGLTGECPVTRFAAYVDSEGRTWGVIEPFIEIQDRINQTVFDLLMAQSYTAWEVRTATGMAPPVRLQLNERTQTMEPVLDDNGNPVPDRVYLNASRFLYAEDKDVKFGSLPGGKLDGFIDAIELAIRNLSALSQTPPHFLLGQIANIAAEALQAAELSLSRKIDSFRNSFGESWERVFRLTSILLGKEIDGDYSGAVVWRDLGASSLAQSSDALGKFADSLEIPKEGLWPRVPGVTRPELTEWKRLKDEANTDRRIVETAAGMLRGPSVAPASPAKFAQEAMTSDQPTTTG